MNVLIVYSVEPFSKSKYEYIAHIFERGLTHAGGKCQILRLPLSSKDNSDHKETILGLHLLKIDNTDILISLNEPAHYLSHVNHISFIHENKLPENLSIVKTHRTIWCTHKKINDQLIQLNMKHAALFTKPTTQANWNELYKQISDI